MLYYMRQPSQLQPTMNYYSKLRTNFAGGIDLSESQVAPLMPKSAALSCTTGNQINLESSN